MLKVGPGWDSGNVAVCVNQCEIHVLHVQKIPSRQQSEGFHQPSSQDLGSTFFEKVLESIKEGGVQSNSNLSSNHEEIPTTAPPQAVTTAQLGEAVTNLLSNLCIQNQPAPIPAPTNQPNPILEALINQMSVASATPALPDHGAMQGNPGLNAPIPHVQAGIPMPYFPVATGALPPGMAPYQMAEAVSGYPSPVPHGSHPVAPVSPFNGVNNMIVPDAITSAYGAMNLVPNGTNMNDLIQTILSLQTQGYHSPMGGMPYMNGNGYAVPYNSMPPQPLQMPNVLPPVELLANDVMVSKHSTLKKAESANSEVLMCHGKSSVNCGSEHDSTLDQQASGTLRTAPKEAVQSSPTAPGFSLPTERRRSVSGIV